MDRPVSLQHSRVDLAASEPFALGSAQIVPAAHAARIADRRERIQPQTMKVLVALHQRRGELVSRDELIERCWDGRIVGDDVINRCISLLRRFTARAGGFVIETVPKAGYRLVEIDAQARQAPGRRRVVAVLIGALVALTGALLLLDPPDRQGNRPMPTVALLPISFDASDPRSRELALATGDSLAHLLRDSGFTPRRIAARAMNGKPPADLVIDGSIRARGEVVEADVRVEETRHGMIIFSRRMSVPWAESSGLPTGWPQMIATNPNWTGALMILDRRRPAHPQIVAELLKQLSMTVEDDDFLGRRRRCVHNSGLGAAESPAQYLTI